MKKELTIRLRGQELQVIVEPDGTISVDGKPHRVDVLKASRDVITVSIDGRVLSAATKRGSSGGDGSSPSVQMAVRVGGKEYDVEVDDERSRLIKSFHPAAGVKSGITRVKAPMPGLVVRLEVEKGQLVKPGQGILVLEAMKMENEIRSTAEGIIDSISVKPGEAVEKDALLVVIRAPEST